MVAATYRRTFNSSELSRNPKSVFEAVEDEPVLVTRRDGQNLVLMTEEEADERRQMLTIAAQIIAATTRNGGSLAERLSDALPWMLALSEEAREACARELVDSSRAAFSTHQPRVLLSTVNSWFETSSAQAAGLHLEASDWLDESELVEQP